MMMMLIAILAFLATAAASCDNSCSGHGTCGLNGVCTCYDNWGLGMSHDSGDCSERICPFEFSWVDTPDENGAHHKYTECASKGICDRDSGLCECFAGYEGKACQRTTCPNSCSGHGTCEYIENLGHHSGAWDHPDTASFHDQDAKTFDYKYWDKTKTRGCVCDPEYGDVDCSKRMCPYGNDVMDHRLDMNNGQEYHTQSIEFVTFNAAGGNEADTKTFALTFQSRLNETFTTVPINFLGATDTGAVFGTAVKNALEGLPNRVIDGVTVTATNAVGSPSAGYDTTTLNIKFTGNFVQGTQNLLGVKSFLCADGCTPKLDGLTLKPGSHKVEEVDATAGGATDSADFNSFECGRRGKCDYDSGVCECFEGYTGIACNTISALV